MSVTKALMALGVATALAVTTQDASAFDLSKVTARVRVINIVPADKSDAIGALNVPSDHIDVANKVAPDIDFEYALAPNWGLELLLTVPQRHDVTAVQADGTRIPIGSVQHLPPTLTAKYYFLTDNIRPYVGAGVNFTWFTSNDLEVPGVGKLSIDSTSFGLAYQAGVDVSVNKSWHVSIDAKKAFISTDVSLGGTKLSTVHVDPYIYGVGVGYRF